MVQPNSQYGNSIYFPYAAGTLVAYAFRDEKVKSEFTFKSFIYKKSDIDEVVESFENPCVVGFSCYVWNYEYNKVLAKKIKEKYPYCKIIFGGHQIYRESDVLKSDFIDFAIFGEGEEIFRKLLLFIAGKETAENIPNIMYKIGNEIVFTEKKRADIPERISPYLEGYFDELVEKEELEFSAILETNRGCPNKCAFCDWGNEKAKVRLYDIETVKAEIDWMSRNKIEYCYCADANFGLFERDEDIIEYMIGRNCENGYPQKFQATYSKNNSETVFRINKRLNDAGMCKGATLSFQSLHQNVLDNIYRKNMPIESFHELMSMYNKNGIGSYSEIILGLPGETYESFRDGMEQLLECGQHMSINFFNCELLMNSIMNDPEYMKKYEIEYAVTEQHQYHVVPDKRDVTEFSRIVVSTSSMSKEMWIKSNIFAVFVRAFHNLGLFQCIAIYLYYERKIKYSDFYESLIEYAVKNPETICGKIYSWLEEKYREVLSDAGSLTCTVDGYGELTWPLDEGAFLKAMKSRDEFYSEMNSFLEGYFTDKKLFEELLSYQKNIVKNPFSKGAVLELDYDFYSYFSNVYQNNYKPLEKRKHRLKIDSSLTPSDLPEYAKKIVWYGRKGGQNIIKKTEYLD